MTSAMERPVNFLLIVADDLGFSDIGPFGGEIPTPALDELAKDGLRFSDYHTAAACSPTRSMLMSGTDNHLAGIGVMYEHRIRDPERWNVPGHEGYLNLDVAALPEVLADNGYWNVLSGKWHLGFRDEHLPPARGFHKSWSLLPGCNNHFGWEPNWINREGDFPRIVGHLPPLYVEEGHKVMPDANTTNSADGFYSSSFYVDKMIDYFEKRTPEEAAKPFFGYLPFSAPHWPLQCLPEDRDKFKGMYDEGPDALRKARLESLIRHGFIDASVRPHDVVAKTAEWDEMTEDERRLSARSMEVYAGMVHSMDRAIGKMLDYLKSIDQYDNTVIIFQSDNGAEGAALEAAPTMGFRLLDAIKKYYNNSYENLGNHDSFIWYGPRWAQASTAPSRLFKGFTTEGGIRVPMIVRYPPFVKGGIAPGSIVRAFTTSMDVMPTYLDLAGIKHPNLDTQTRRCKAPYRDRQVFAMRGKSIAPYLCSQESSKDDVHGVYPAEDAAVGWEHLGRASLRLGGHKIVFIPKGEPSGIGAWQLYDMETDPGETNDIAKQQPDVYRRLLAAWDEYQAETGTVFGPPVKPGTSPLLEDQIGGDPMLDQKAWMGVGTGSRFPGHAKASAVIV